MKPIQITSKILKYNHNLVNRQKVQTNEDGEETFDRENEKELLEMLQRLVDKLKITEELEVKILEYLTNITNHYHKQRSSL